VVVWGAVDRRVHRAFHTVFSWVIRAPR
jgi:hypothetical protein